MPPAGSVNFNVEDYRTEELLHLLGLSRNTTEQEVKNSCRSYITKYTKSGEELYKNFFMEAREKLIKFVEMRNEKKKGK